MPRYNAPELWGFRKAGNDVLDSNIPDHYQLAGRATGYCRIAGEEFRIDCIGYRDHSWGVRDWSTLLGPFRCFTATFGPDLAISYNPMVGPDGRRFTIGHVYDRGTVSRIVRGDLVVLQEFDGITSRGARAVVETERGEQLCVEIDAIDDIALEADDFRSFFAVGRARSGPRLGVGSCEVFNNVPTVQQPEYVGGAAMTDGPSRFLPFGTLR